MKLVGIDRMSAGELNWGIPWGPIWTIQSLAVNFRGGKDVTDAVVKSLSAGAGAAAAK